MSELRYEITYGPDDDSLRAWLSDCHTKLPVFRASMLGSTPERKNDGTLVRQILIVTSLPEDQAKEETEERLRRNGLTFKKL